MHSLDRFYIILSFIVLLSFSAVLIAVYHAPLFVDDAHWPIQNGRVLYDGLHMLNLYPQCTANFAWPVPGSLLPGRIFAALLHPESIIGFRILGMTKYLLCIGLLTALAYYMLQKTIPLIIVLAAVTAALSIGSLPIIMTLDRPETAIFIGMGLMMALVLLSRHHRVSNINSSIWILCYLLILSWLLSLHPKMQFLIPATWIGAFLLSIDDKRLRLVLFAGVLILSAACVELWSTHSKCPEYTKVEDRLRRHSILPQDLGGNPEYIAKEVGVNLMHAPENYLPAFQVTDRYMEFMPPQKEGEPVLKALQSVTYYAGPAILLIIIGFFLFVSTSSLINLFRARTFDRLAEWSLPLALFLPAAVSIATLKHSYIKEGGLILATLLLGLFWYAWLNGWCKHPKRLKTAAAIFMAVAILSQATFYLRWHDFLSYTADPKNFSHGKIDTDNRFQAIFDAPERNSAFLQVATLCNIENNASMHHLVVDDFSYTSFQKSYQPFYGRTLFIWGVPGNDFIEFLQKNNSDGVVALCSNLPKQLRPLAIEQNGLCCISKERINNP